MTLTTADNASPAVQAMFLKQHLKLMSIGMRNSQITNRQMLDKAAAITGKKYKRGAYGTAIDDLQKIIDAAIAAKAAEQAAAN